MLRLYRSYLMTTRCWEQEFAWSGTESLSIHLWPKARKSTCSQKGAPKICWPRPMQAILTRTWKFCEQSSRSFELLLYAIWMTGLGKDERSADASGLSMNIVNMQACHLFMLRSPKPDGRDSACLKHLLRTWAHDASYRFRFLSIPCIAELHFRCSSAAFLHSPKDSKSADANIGSLLQFFPFLYGCYTWWVVSRLSFSKPVVGCCTVLMIIFHNISSRFMIVLGNPFGLDRFGWNILPEVRVLAARALDSLTGLAWEV